MTDTNSSNEKQIWGALFAVSSFLYRTMEDAPERDPLRWHLQDIAVRLLRETSAHVFEAEGDPATVDRVVRQLLATTELLRERSWISAETMQTLSKHIGHLQDSLSQWRKTTEQEEADTQKEEPEKQSSSSKKTTTTSKKKTTKTAAPNKAKQTERHQRTTRRQQRIVDILEEVDGHIAPSSFFAEAFPGVTARTIRRDLQALVERGMVRQEGSGRGARYRLVEEKEAIRT